MYNGITATSTITAIIPTTASPTYLASGLATTVSTVLHAVENAGINISYTVDDLPEELQDAVTASEDVPAWMGVIAIAIIAWGIFEILKPDEVWHLEHMFTVEGGYPTDFYLIGTRIVGVIHILCGIVLLALQFGSRGM